MRAVWMPSERTMFEVDVVCNARRGVVQRSTKRVMDAGVYEAMCE